MAALPSFTVDGLLPPGEYSLNFSQLRVSHPKGRPRMWHVYRVELWPNIYNPKRLSLPIDRMFKMCRETGKPRGIILMKK